MGRIAVAAGATIEADRAQHPDDDGSVWGSPVMPKIDLRGVFLCMVAVVSVMAAFESLFRFF